MCWSSPARSTPRHSRAYRTCSLKRPAWFTLAELETLDIHETQWRQLRDYLNGTYPHVD
jgi:hypothetical protein